MKNIETILADAGVTLTDDQKAAVTKAVSENYKTVSEFTSKVTKLEGERDSYKAQYTDTKAALDKFDGADIEALKQQIADEKKRAQEAEDNAKKQMADRDYADAVKAAAAETKFSSNAAQRDFMSQLQGKRLPVSDGKLLGYADFLEGYKKENPGALVDEAEGEKAKFTDQLGQGNPPKDPKDAEMESMMRKVMGIPEEKKG